MRTYLEPEGSPLSDGGELGGLEVGEPEGGERLVLLGEVGQSRDHDRELVDDETESVPKEDEIGVARRDRCGVWRSVRVAVKTEARCREGRTR